VEKRYDELEARVRALEATVGVFERLLGASLATGPRPNTDTALPLTTASDEFEPKLLAMLTTKQHVAMQMLIAGKSNAEIAERFGVTENGAKVYVRAIYKKFGVNTRSQAVMAVYDEWDKVDDGRYLALSRGVPKDWVKTCLVGSVEDDPYRRLYQALQPDE
jgi:DNA-binding CsgD family transcriptional regulator